MHRRRALRGHGDGTQPAGTAVFLVTPEPAGGMAGVETPAPPTVQRGAQIGGRYNAALDRWLPLPVVGDMPIGGVAVWTGREMIVWGSRGTEYVGSRFLP